MQINGVPLEYLEQVTPHNGNFIHDFRCLSSEDTDLTLHAKLVGNPFRSFTIVQVHFMRPGVQYNKVLGLEVTRNE